MSASKRVLLARPHPMIKEEMRAFLSHNGYEPVATEDLEEIARLGGGGTAGIVISTTIISGTNASLADVLNSVRTSLPMAPILIATLLPEAILSRSLNPILTALKPSADLIRAETAALNNAKLGTNLGILALHRDDVRLPERVELSGMLVRRHFS